MTGFEHVITIDGASGTGKTTLLRAFVERYDCVAIELGPVVRAVSWLAERKGVPVADAVALLARLQGQGRLRIDRPAAGELAASEIELDGLVLRQQIFSGSLAPALAAASLETEAMAWIHSLVRETVRGRRAIVSAREAARRVCPTAGLRIHLEAAEPVRATRKRRQLALCGVAGPWTDDAPLLGSPGPVHTVVDTTAIGPDELTDRVAAMAEEWLRWSPAAATPVAW